MPFGAILLITAASIDQNNLASDAKRPAIDTGNQVASLSTSHIAKTKFDVVSQLIYREAEDVIEWRLDDDLVACKKGIY